MCSSFVLINRLVHAYKTEEEVQGIVTKVKALHNSLHS